MAFIAKKSIIKYFMYKCKYNDQCVVLISRLSYQFKKYSIV